MSLNLSPFIHHCETWLLPNYLVFSNLLNLFQMEGKWLKPNLPPGSRKCSPTHISDSPPFGSVVALPMLASCGWADHMMKAGQWLMNTDVMCIASIPSLELPVQNPAPPPPTVISSVQDSGCCMSLGLKIWWQGADRLLRQGGHEPWVRSSPLFL